MRLARSMMYLGILVFAASAHDAAADQASHCTATIQRRGTTLFANTADVVARCARRQLRTADFSEGCPNTDDNDRIDVLGTMAFDAIQDSCGPTPSALGSCLAYQGIEASAIPLNVLSFANAPTRGAKLRCIDTITKQTVRLGQYEARQLATCNTKVATGIAGYGPTGPTCDGPNGTQARMADARARVAAKLGRACGGPDGVAGSGDDLDPQADLGYAATCSGRPYCEFAIDTLPELISCATCIATEEVGQLARGLASMPLDAATACDVAKHQAALLLLVDDMTDMAACEDRILDGHEAGPCPNAETISDLAANAGRYDSRVNGSCGGSGAEPFTTFEDLAAYLIAGLYPAHVEEPNSALKRCKVEIASSATSSQGYARRKTSALRVCTVQRACGQTTAACPDSEADAAIQRAAALDASGIHTRCDAYTPAMLGYPATCPSLGSCSALPTTTIDELITCIRCIGDEVVDAALAASF
jgi:hypothetical protein